MYFSSFHCNARQAKVFHFRQISVILTADGARLVSGETGGTGARAECIEPTGGNPTGEKPKPMTVECPHATTGAVTADDATAGRWGVSAPWRSDRITAANPCRA
jgi:hypothetical protein